MLDGMGGVQHMYDWKMFSGDVTSVVSGSGKDNIVTILCFVE